MSWTITLTLDDAAAVVATFLDLRAAHGYDAVDLFDLERNGPPAGEDNADLDPSDVDCPHCGATAGEPCRTPIGATYANYHHAARKAATS